MPEYVLFIYDDEAAWAGADPQVSERVMQHHQEFIASNGSALRGGNRLHPSSTSTSIRRDSSGAVSVSDGAFAETKEVIGGYYLIEAEDLDEALSIAKQVPAPFGGVEVRPVWSTQ